MWQVLVAAAVAGSGVFVKRLLHDRDFKSDPDLKSSEPSLKADQILEQPSLSPTQNPSKPSEESVFRFSSASVSPYEDGRVAKKSRTKMGRGTRGGSKIGDGNVEAGSAKSGKRFVVCLRKNKRRTGKSASVESQYCPRQDDSSFALGLGAGLMYMMSAGRSEISRLNTTIDETAKVVQELKTELARRKSSRSPDSSSLRAEDNPNFKRSRGNNSQSLVNKSSNETINESKVDGSFLSNEGGCGSSCLTEELHPGVLMDQLEAELETEFQKIPWEIAEASSLEKSSDTFEFDPEPIFGAQTEIPAKEFNKLDRMNSKTCQHTGVLPSELDQNSETTPCAS